jgi:hypothetical protein
MLRERKALEKHAQVEGCRLILNPWVDYDQEHGPGVTYTRLHTLVEFLESAEPAGAKFEVAIRARDCARARPYCLTILGDWFLSESFAGTAGMGYQQTMFTRHAPTVRTRLETFDQEFNELLEESGIPLSSSKAAAISLLKDRLQELPRPAPHGSPACPDSSG